MSLKFRKWITAKREQHRQAAVYTKEINGKEYTYQALGEHLFKKTAPDGKVVYLKKLPEDLF